MYISGQGQHGELQDNGVKRQRHQIQCKCQFNKNWPGFYACFNRFPFAFHMPSIYLLLLSLSLLLSPFALKLQTSSTTEEQRQGGSPSLRRSPRIDEMDHYEERWRQSEEASHSTSQPPSISVQQPDTAPWRDQYGLLMEGISDFYDFTASVNPSRSRPSSRNASPQPRNVANCMDVDEEHTLEVYDDTQDGLITGELNCELVPNA